MKEIKKELAEIKSINKTMLEILEILTKTSTNKQKSDTTTDTN